MLDEGRESRDGERHAEVILAAAERDGQVAAGGREELCAASLQAEDQPGEGEL